MRRRRIGIATAVIAALAGFLAWTGIAKQDRAMAAAQREAVAAAMAPRSGAADGKAKEVATLVGRAAAINPNHPIRPLPAAGTPLRQVLASLKQQASEGDAAAACRIAFELDRCAKLPMLRSGPSFWSRGLDKLSARARADTEWHLENSKRRLAEAESACEGVSPEEFAWTFDYALAAALAGNREARWFMSFWPVGLDAMYPSRTLEGWARWRQDIRGIMEAGIADGDPRIMRMASRAYTDVVWGYRIFPEDGVRAVALQFAIDRAAADAYRGFEANNGLFIARQVGLSAEQIDEARRLSASLSVAQAPEGGIDWRRGMSPEQDGAACERDR